MKEKEREVSLKKKKRGKMNKDLKFKTQRLVSLCLP